jgi:8-oxo-dGTP pyrophosphatase MutT (NUDIX family)
MRRVGRSAGIDWRLIERRRRGRDRGWQTSGGVVLDRASGKVLLVQNRRERREGRAGWTWPKGRIDRDEGPVFAALREVAEEAGVQAEPVALLLRMRTRRALRHYYLLVKIRGGLPVASETLAVRWVRPARAMRLLERGRDRMVLLAAVRALRELRELRELGASLATPHFSDWPRAPTQSGHDSLRPTAHRG